MQVCQVSAVSEKNYDFFFFLKISPQCRPVKLSDFSISTFPILSLC